LYELLVSRQQNKVKFKSQCRIAYVFYVDILNKLCRLHDRFVAYYKVWNYGNFIKYKKCKLPKFIGL